MNETSYKIKARETYNRVSKGEGVSVLSSRNTDIYQGHTTPTDEDQDKFNANLIVAEKLEETVPLFLEDGRKIIWCPQEGSQTSFLECGVFEVLLEGTRGPGKTDALIMSFANFCDPDVFGFGYAWRGILFRQTYPQLADIVAKTKKWFPHIFGKRVKFNGQAMAWVWNTGETLLLRHIRTPDDYYKYHGHEYPWIGFEELTNWGNDTCFVNMQSCCRSPIKKIPRMIRSTTNPYGIGHNWVKDRYRLPEYRSKVITDARDMDGRLQPMRVAIFARLEENKILLSANPDYPTIIAASAANPAQRKAWLEADWSIVAGGMFDDVWYDARKYVTIDSFKVPHSWAITRSFDWGSSKPFSVGWWAESDGTDLTKRDGTKMSTVRGDLFRFHEWYGWTGKANQGNKLTPVKISEGIVERELKMGIYGRVHVGIADAQIFAAESDGTSQAMNMAKEILYDKKRYPGLYWEPCDKSPGSREAGWEELRSRMLHTIPKNGLPREHKGLFVVRHCLNFFRTVPVLPRDPIKLDDVDDDAEDHIGDEMRYRVMWNPRTATSGKTKGA